MVSSCPRHEASAALLSNDNAFYTRAKVRMLFQVYDMKALVSSLPCSRFDLGQFENLPCDIYTFITHIHIQIKLRKSATHRYTLGSLASGTNTYNGVDICKNGLNGSSVEVISVQSVLPQLFAVPYKVMIVRSSLHR